MANCNASKNNQWLLDWFKRQTITTRDKKIHNYFRDVPSKKRKHFSTYFDSFMFIIKKKIASLKCKASLNIIILLVNLQKKFKIAMLECLIRIKSIRKGNSYGKKLQ